MMDYRESQLRYVSFVDEHPHGETTWVSHHGLSRESLMLKNGNPGCKKAPGPSG